MKKGLPVLLFMTAVTGALVSPCEGQKFSFGSCPTVASAAITIATLSTTTTWRVYARTPSFHGHFLRCGTYTFVSVTTNLVYRYAMNAVNKVTGTSVIRSGTVIVGGGLATANLAATSYLGFIDDNGYKTKTIRYYVIYADLAAVTYFVLYSCEDVAFGKLESAMLLASAAITVTATDIVTYSTSALASVGADTKLLQRTYDPNC